MKRYIKCNSNTDVIERIMSFVEKRDVYSVKRELSLLPDNTAIKISIYKILPFFWLNILFKFVFNILLSYLYLFKLYQTSIHFNIYYSFIVILLIWINK